MGTKPSEPEVIEKFRRDVTTLKPKVVIIEHEYYMKFKFKKKGSLFISSYLLAKASFTSEDKKEYKYTYITDDIEDRKFIDVLEDLGYEHIVTKFFALNADDSEEETKRKAKELIETRKPVIIKLDYQKTIYTDGEVETEDIKGVVIEKNNEKLVYVLRERRDPVDVSEVILTGFEIFTPTIIANDLYLFHIKNGNIKLVYDDEGDSLLKSFGITRKELYDKLKTNPMKLEEILNEKELNAVLETIKKSILSDVGIPINFRPNIITVKMNITT